MEKQFRHWAGDTHGKTCSICAQPAQIGDYTTNGKEIFLCQEHRSVDPDAARNMKGDPLLAYAIALDANNPEQVLEVLKLAETDTGLESAIFTIHQKFDSDESFTKQLLHIRQQLEGARQP